MSLTEGETYPVNMGDRSTTTLSGLNSVPIVGPLYEASLSFCRRNVNKLQGREPRNYWLCYKIVRIKLSIDNGNNQITYCAVIVLFLMRNNKQNSEWNEQRNGIEDDKKQMYD